MMKRDLTLPPEPTTPIAELRQRVQDTWNNLSQDDIRHLYERLNERIHACVATRGGTVCINVTVRAPITLACMFNFVGLYHTGCF